MEELEESTSQPVIQRPEATYVDNCSKYTFGTDKPNYERQFNELYHARLDALRPRIIEAAAKKWGPEKPVRKLTDLYDNKDQCIIIGTIYKVQELKPSVLKEIADEASILPQPIRALKLTSDNDKCILEDENLRVNLTGPDIDHGLLVTGVTVGVYGWQEEGGSFEVMGICFAEPPRPPSPLIVPSSFEGDDRFVLLISGLNFHGSKEGDDDDARRVLYCRLLSDWITGKVGIEEELSKISRIVRVIIAGGSISDKSHNDGREFGQIARYRARKAAPPTVEAVKSMDEFLNEIVESIDVDVMPGEYDPTNHMLPQQPIHRCLLPKSAVFSSLHQCTNPYAAEINGIRFLGTSGQNIDDVLKYSTIDDSLTALESTLTWCHLSPTCPDTLGCYPFYQTDPFLIEDELPHVYFCGNQPSLQSKILDHPNDTDENDGESGVANRKTLLLSLPKFNESGTCALVNLRTLQVEPVIFSADDLFNGHHENGNGLSDFSMEVDTDDTPVDSAQHSSVSSAEGSSVTGTPDLFS